MDRLETLGELLAFAAHDAWVTSLKESAEAVLRKQQETRSALAAAGVRGDTSDEGLTPEGPR